MAKERGWTQCPVVSPHPVPPAFTDALLARSQAGFPSSFEDGPTAQV